MIEAKRLYELNKKLYEKGAIGRQEYQSSLNSYNYQKQRMELTKKILKQDSIATKQEIEQAKNSYQRTQSALKLMRKKVGDLVVRAPIDGQLTSLDAEIGQSKTKGQRLGQLDVITAFKVRIEVDEFYISRIYTGQTGTFTLNSKTYTLVIKKVFTQVTGGRFQVDMQFENEVPEGIRRGQNLQIRLALSAEKEALVVDKGGFFQKTGGNWVFKVSEDGSTAYKVDVRLGSQNTQYYEVISGLQKGDRVITSTSVSYTHLMNKLWYLIVLILITSCGNEPEKCESFKFGKFYVFMDGSNASYYKIDRSENEQKELDTKGNTMYYEVEWLSKCSYVIKFDSERNELAPEMKMINEDGGLVIVLENTPSRENCINYTSYVKEYRESSERKGMFCKEKD